MSFFEHLAELRKRLIYSMLAVLVGTIAGFTVARRVYLVLVLPIVGAFQATGQESTLISTSPTGPLNLYLKLSIYIGFVLAFPVVLYQVWLFIAPGCTSMKSARPPCSLFPLPACFWRGSRFAISFCCRTR